ncbi:uncharacterized protein LOC106881281 [Octopus bimaculoides]|nr:uncharacterized protein LOC106881281 [Octopus bimaculoides]|eukprot:XP_014787098.1 PREDICTED: uncharacterized protein LOC106881281 isoform X2 [Octopus bimaculoides]
MKGLEAIFKEDIIEARNSLRSTKKQENSDSVKPMKKDLHDAFYYELTQTCLTRQKRWQEEKFSKLPNSKNQILGNVVDKTKKHTEDLLDKNAAEKFNKLSANNSFNSNSSENLKINGDFKNHTSLNQPKQPNLKSETQKGTDSARSTNDWTPMQDLEDSENSDTESSVKNSQRNSTTGFKCSLIPENIKYLNNTKEFYSRNCPKPEYDVTKHSFTWKNEQSFIKSNSNKSKNGKEPNPKTCEVSENIGWDKSSAMKSNSKYKNGIDFDYLEKKTGRMSEQHHLGRVKHEGEKEKENDSQRGWNVWKKQKKFPKESTVNTNEKQQLKVTESQISQKEEDMEKERLNQMEIESEFLKKRSNQRLVMGNWKNKLTKVTKQSLAGMYDLEENRKNYTNNDEKEAGFNEDITKCNKNTRKENEKVNSKNEVNFDKTRAQLQENSTSLNGSAQNHTQYSESVVSNNEGLINDILLKPQIEKQNASIYFPNSLAPNYVPNPFLGISSNYFGTSYLNEYLKLVGIGQPFLPMNLTYHNIPGYLGTSYNMMPQATDIYEGPNFVNPLPFLPSVFNNFSAMSESKSKDVQNPVYTSDSDDADSLYQSPGTYTDQMSNWSSDNSKSIQTEDLDNSDSTQSSDVYMFQANKERDEGFDSGNAFSSEFETMTSQMKYSKLEELS